MPESLPEDAVFSRPLTLRIREACRLTGIGRSKLYELIAAGEIEIIKVGAITLVPVSCNSALHRLTRRVCRAHARNSPKRQAPEHV